MYKRITIYPNGLPIPESLPDSYQPTYLGNAPTGQSCFTCRNFDMTTRYCSAFAAPVRPRWWCEGWSKPYVMRVTQKQLGTQLLKKITTSTIEEHFSEISKPKSSQPDFDFVYDYDNQEDVIRLNVPLMIRLLEWAREDSSKDIELHIVAERLIALSDDGETLTMGDYPEIVYQVVEVEKKEK